MKKIPFFSFLVVALKRKKSRSTEKIGENIDLGAWYSL